MKSGSMPLHRKLHSWIMLNNVSLFQESLDKRKEEGTLRRLKLQPDGIDFYSNDYLGFAKSKDLQQLLLQKVTNSPELLSGSTGSRLISGNSDMAVFFRTQKLSPPAPMVLLTRESRPPPVFILFLKNPLSQR